MNQPAFWGPFATLLEDADVNVSEVNLYSEELIDAYDHLYPIDDFDFYAELAARHGDPILELGCGTGRVLVQLAELGFATVGIDNSPAALKVAAERVGALSPALRERVTLIEGDATAFELANRFQLVLLPASSIVLFSQPGAVDAMFRAVAAHLSPDGVFAFDFPLFDAVASEQWDEKIVEVVVPIKATNARVRLGCKATADRAFLNINTHWEFPGSSGPSRHFLERKVTAIIAPDVIEARLGAADLVVRERRTHDLPGGAGVRRVLVCGRARTERCPLWQPHTPMSALTENRTSLVSGKGSQVQDDSGKEYIDLAGGLWSAQCGLGHPRIIDAINRQLERLSHGALFVGMTNEPAESLARRLVELVPNPLPWVYLTGSGSESVELSIKIARRFHLARDQAHRSNIVYLSHSYHGTFFGSMAVSGLHDGRSESGPVLPGMLPVPAPIPWLCPRGVSQLQFESECAAAFERLVATPGSNVAALIVEPILGSAGAIVPSSHYFAALQATCRRFGVLLILDEVATGFGRTGTWFAVEQLAIRPDILLLAKGISSGYLPLGAVLFSTEIGAALMDRRMSLAHGSSHNGNPVCCAAGLATIDVIQQEGLVARSAEIGAFFRSALESLATEIPAIKRVHGLGMMLGLELSDTDGAPATSLQIATLYMLLKDVGILTYPAESSLVFVPPLTIAKGQIETSLTYLKGILQAVRLVAGEVRLHA